MAPQGRNGRRHEPVDRLPAVLVLVAALDPRLATCVSSRSGKIGNRQRFAVEMAGDLFADPQKAAAASADVHASPGKIESVHLFPYKDRRSVRVVFDLDPGSETYSELRLTLSVDNQAASETWLYRWTA